MGLSVAMAETPPAAPTELDPETGQQVISIPDVAGPSWWAILHGWAQAIHDAGCPSCGEHAITLAQFMHDLVNVRLGKPLHSPAVAEEWLPVVEEYQRHLTSGGQGSATPTGDEAEHYLGRLAGLVGQQQKVKEITVIPYHSGLDIRNLDQLPRGTGAKYLIVIPGQEDEYIASRWARKLPKYLEEDEVAIKMKQSMQEKEHQHHMKTLEMEQGFPKLKVKPGTPQKMDEDDNPTFERWMQRIDAVLSKYRGVSVHDLPDAPFCDWYDARLRPIHAANKVLRRVSSEQVLEQEGGEPVGKGLRGSTWVSALSTRAEE